MTTDLPSDQIAAVSMLLQAGKTVREIAKFASLDEKAVTGVARTLDLEPEQASHKRAKALFGSADGLTYQAIAKILANEGFTADGDEPMHHLTVASWVRNYGWPWGGAGDGEYAPERAATAAARTRYVLRLSKTLDAELNRDADVNAAADKAWDELSSDRTRIVQLAVIRGAGQVGVTNLTQVKKALMEKHGDELRSATLPVDNV